MHYLTLITQNYFVVPMGNSLDYMQDRSKGNMVMDCGLPTEAKLAFR